MRQVKWLIGVLLGLSAGGCLIDDSGGARGRASQGPSASVPDTGSPIRRESASKTLNEADPNKPADAELQVDPGRTPPPPVQ